MTTYKYKNGSWGPGRVEHFTGVEGLGAWAVAVAVAGAGAGAV